MGEGSQARTSDTVDGVRKTLAQRKSVIEELVKAIKQYKQSQDHQSIHALNKALERAELLLEG